MVRVTEIATRKVTCAADLERVRSESALRASAETVSVAVCTSTGCGACAAVCPVGAIEVRVSGDDIEIAPFGNRVRLARCGECGTPIGSVPLSERVQKELGDVARKTVELCIDCKQRQAGARAWKVARLGVGAIGLRVL
jgi:ferredoxin